MAPTYFAQDGSWGDAEGLLILDVSRWSEMDFEIIRDAPDFERMELAQQMNAWVLNNRSSLAGMDLLTKHIKENLHARHLKRVS